MSLFVSLLPDVADTTLRLHDPDINRDGTPRHIVAFCVDGAKVQFATPAEAVAWLDHCHSLLAHALAPEGQPAVFHRLPWPT